MQPFWIVTVSILIGMVGYYYYFRDLFAGRTKPHALSWFIWGMLTGIAFFAQLAGGGGAGAWINGITSGICFLISLFSYLKYGLTYVRRLDWFCLFGALSGIALWRITNNPLLAIITVGVVDLIAYVPTFRKGYHHPREETARLYVLETVKYLFGILALEAWNPTTLIYPLLLTVTNTSFVSMLLMRRKTLKL